MKERSYMSEYMAENPYERLASAIIVQAAMDYRRYLKGIDSNPMNHEVKMQVEEVESFFLSSWFGLLSTLNGKYLMNRIKSEIMCKSPPDLCGKM